MKWGIFILFFFPVCTTVLSSHEDLQISLLTCGPGNTIEAIYGHNAIRVHNKTSGTDITYNYGTFDFDTPHFAIKFMRGKLPYKISASRYEDFLNYYHFVGRSVTEQVLNLDSLEKSEIIAFLNENMRPENREYMYDFFMDNCATRIRDVFETHVNELQWNVDLMSDKTFRQIIKEYQARLPWTDFGIDLIIGAGADKIADYRESTFIPDYLSIAVSRMTSGKEAKPVEKNKYEILNSQQSLSHPFFFQTPLFLFLCLLIIEFIGFGLAFTKLRQNAFWKMYDKVWMIILFLAGVLMIFMWWGTDHIHTKQNWNILWASPLLPFWYWTQKHGGKWVNFLFYIVFCLLFFSMLNGLPWWTIFPQYFHPAVALVCAILILKMLRGKIRSGQKASLVS